MKNEEWWGRFILNSSFNILNSEFTNLVNREVVPRLICPGLLFPKLHENIVQKRRSTKPEHIRRHPQRSHRLVQQHEIRERELGVGDAAGGLHPDLLSGDVMEIADRFEHH